MGGPRIVAAVCEVGRDDARPSLGPSGKTWIFLALGRAAHRRGRSGGTRNYTESLTPAPLRAHEAPKHSAFLNLSEMAERGEHGNHAEGAEKPLTTQRFPCVFCELRVLKPCGGGQSSERMRSRRSATLPWSFGQSMDPPRTREGRASSRPFRRDTEVHGKPHNGLTFVDRPQVKHLSVGFSVSRSGLPCRVAAMQRIAEARPWADACLHANSPMVRRARAQLRAATRFRGRAKRPSSQPCTLCVSASLLSLR